MSNEITVRYTLRVEVRLGETLRVALGTGEPVAATALTATWTDRGVHLTASGTAYRADGSVGKARRSGMVSGGMTALPLDLRDEIEHARNDLLAGIDS